MNFSLFNMEPSADITISSHKEEMCPSLQDKYSKLFAGLDEFQREVVAAPVNACMQCVAGAGSGKTKTIISRAIKLVIEDKVDPSKIVLITFTNKAAKELKERYVKFFEGSTNTLTTPQISTIHSFCLSQIRRMFGFSRTILSEYQSRKLFRDITVKHCLNKKMEKPDVGQTNRLQDIYESLISNFNIYYVGLPAFDKDGVFQEFIPYSRIANISGNEFFKKLPVEVFAQRYRKGYLQSAEECIKNALSGSQIPLSIFSEVCRDFLREKYKNNTLDFGDMSFQQVLLLGQHTPLRERVWGRVEHIIMDEAQDTESIQAYSCIFSDKDSFSEIFLKNS